MPKTRPTKIENGVQLWPCTKCGRWLPKESFYTDTRLEKGRWGIRGRCKDCSQAAMREYAQRPTVQVKERARSLVRGKTLEHKARVMVHDAIRAGRLVRPNFCPICGISDKVKRIEAHHEDYFRPLEVDWKCSSCHRKYDKAKREKALALAHR